MKQPQFATLTLDKIVGGGQALGTLEDGRKAFVWGGLPGETVTIRITKKKSHLVEGVVTEIHQASPERIAPLDPVSYLSTSPWQLMTFDAEQRYKAALIEEAFELHNIVLPQAIEVMSDDKTAHYRNKVEFSWYSMGGEWGLVDSGSGGADGRWGKRVVANASEPRLSTRHLQPESSADAYSREARSEAVLEGDEGSEGPEMEDGEWKMGATEATSSERHLQPRSSPLRTRGGSGVKPSEEGVGEGDGRWEDEGGEAETLDLAFFRRGSKGKIIIDECSLLPDSIMVLARAIRDLLHSKHTTARSLKTLLIRCDQQGNCAWQLYVKDEAFDFITPDDAAALPAQGGEVIYSDPRSPASRITKRLASFGDIVLQDTLLDTPFRYATEGFFQVNLPIYEQTLRDMKQWIPDQTSTIDMYSGVGTIGLTIGGPNCTLVEIDEHAVREMRRNIGELHSSATAVLAPSEKALEYITGDMVVIVDPPRAGMHRDVISRLLETKPPRIIYLSCNPVTQARDVALLAEAYGIRAHQGYNFFPRTPHIEHLIVLDRKA